MKTPAPPKLSSMEEEATEDEKPMKIAEPQKSVKKSTTSALLKGIATVFSSAVKLLRFHCFDRLFISAQVP